MKLSDITTPKAVAFYISLPKEDRKKELKLLNFKQRKDLLDSIPVLTNILNLGSIKDLEERVKLRHEFISAHPEVELWDHAEYLRSDGHVVHHSADKLIILISTYGNHITYAVDTRMNIAANNDTGFKARYKHLESRRINRIVASTFLPIPDRLKHIPANNLSANHIDENKHNNELKNIEWTSEAANRRHAYGYEDYHNYDYYEVEVVINNGFKGRKFILPFHDEKNPFSMEHAIKHKDATGKSSFYRGMVFTPIAFDDIENRPIGFPKDIAEVYETNPRSFNLRPNHYIGTILVGKYSGLKFGLVGRDHVDEYFNNLGLLKGLKEGRYRIEGCHFKCVTLLEALPICNVMTHEIRLDIAKHDIEK